MKRKKLGRKEWKKREEEGGREGKEEQFIGQPCRASLALFQDINS